MEGQDIAEYEQLKLEKFTSIPDRIKRKLDSMLSEGENLEISVRAIMGTHIEGSNVNARGGRQTGHPWLLITSRRVLLASPGLLSFELRQFRRDSVTSVELQQGVVRDRIIINGMGLREEWVFWRKLRPVTEKAVSMMQNDVSGSKSSDSDITPDPLRELKLRLARGEISEVEFDSLRKKIS